MNKQQNIGFIGLGVMGEPMCRNLSTKSGVKIVAFDRREEPLTRLSMVGVSRAASLAEMADSDVVFLSLPDGEAVQEVCLGNTGLITVLNSGAIVVDLGTSPVTLTRELDSRFKGHDVLFSDAPVARTRAAAEAAGQAPRARILGHAGHAQAPGLFTTAPVPAARKLLDRIGWTKEDVDLWEVNEAFAVVPMAFMQEMGLAREIVNVNGGACALGHPIGASGTRIIVTLLNALEKRGLKRGVAAICIGGGEGTAIAIERV